MSVQNGNPRFTPTIIDIHSPNASSESAHRPSNASRQPKASPKVQEYRKMIQLILTKIIKRKRPPTSLMYLSEQCRVANASDQFENDDTIDLLIQLRSALMVCHSNGLSAEVLLQSERTPSGSPVSSKSNSPVPSPHTGGSPSRSVEASSFMPVLSIKNDKRSDFEKLLSVLSDLVINDSRFRTANPKPSRPPFTMQAILVDIALILVKVRDDQIGLYHIGSVFLPAFEAFSDGQMVGKLLSFYLDHLLPKLIKSKDEPKKAETKKAPSSKNKSPSNKGNQKNTPTINIQSPDQENNVPTKMSHLTIDTRPISMEGSPYSPAAQSQHSSQHQLDNYPMFGLFTPLLFFMIQYLDPYLASYRTDSSQQENLTFTMTRQAHSIHNFHRALGFMMSVKQDLYLDVLQVISHSTSDVKYRACQILLSYYFTSVGHVMVADPLPKLGTQEELEVLDKQREQQEYEEERQRQVESTQYLPTNTMNRKYHHRPNNTLNHQQSIADSISENMVEDHHVWYPHIFVSETPQSADGGSQQHSFSNPNFPLVHDDMNGAFCNECFKPIKGYGLRCYQCKCSVHYNCFNYHIANNDLDIMLYVKAGGIQKVVSPQFCHIPPQPRFRDRVNRGLLGWNIKSNSPKVGLLGHVFHLVNLYTLMICACCGLPLWGISQQGYRCSTCNRFVHPQCLSDAEERNEFVQSRSTIQSCRAYQPLLESDTHISKKELSDDLCDFYSDLLPKTEEELEGRSFEEVGTMLNVLLLQENILHCGEAAGCLLIIGDSDDPLLSPIQQQESTAPSEPSSDTCPGLSRAIQLCKAYLESGRCRGSTFLSDFYNNRHQSLEECLLSKEEYLGHLSAMMKCLTASFSTVAGSLIQADGIENRRSAGDSRGFLKVLPSPFKSQWEDDDDDDEFSQGHMPNESLDRSTLLSWVMTNLHFKSTKAAEVLLQHIRNLGFFERFDASPILFSADTTSNQNAEPITCIFPVPFAIDCSSNVESLINSIDACLQDVDLSINECGLLLLVRRCWPDPFMSHYTNERLIHSILSWVFDEDERLLMLHAEFTANKNPSNRQNKWAQAALLARMKNNGERVRHSGLNQAKMGVNSGASSLYVTTRAALKDRYIVRWMAAIHDMDKEAYTGFIFDSINSIIDSKREECSVPEWQGYSNTKKQVVQKHEQFMTHLMKLKTYGLAFSSLDGLFQRWFDAAHFEFEQMGMLNDKEPAEIRHLAKLCSSKISLPKIHGTPATLTEATHPIDVILAQFDRGNKESIDRGIQWLRLVTHAGTGIPSNSLAHIARLMVAARTPLDVSAEFVKIVWFQAVNILNVPTPRASVIDIIGYLNEIALDTLTANNESDDLSDQSLLSSQTFIRYSAALACYAYGCPLSDINELNLAPHIGDHVSHISQTKRNTLHTDNSALVQADEKTPLIHCMLLYLRFDQLNVREDVIKMFYALTHWGYSIRDPDDFIEKCMPQLIPAIWELLTPAYDSISHINLALLMKLISIDVRYFQACVYKIFEDANWEVRFQGLDNLFGLFTKMDATFQTEWLKLLSYLGPVFSYFVGCLWDKEEYVRSKAYALIRTFGTLHLRSAFRCWEAYFLTATDRQKMSLVSLMIQLNALFPDWQVLQWESLLEALELKTPMSGDSQSVDILEEYMRSATDEAGGSAQSSSESAESENTKVLMLTLALQMLSNHLSIEPTQIARLKYILVQQMGFKTCQLFNDVTEYTVEFGNMVYNPRDPSQVAVMIACIRGLKKIMDCFAPLPAETVATMAPDSLEQNKMTLAENSSPGVHFIDVVLKMMNSGIDLTKLGHMMLKAWLEIILIIVYKHNILDRDYEQDIVGCMKQIIELLTEDISEENKLLILEILKCLLRRSDHLTAMVLSKQILALGKLMTKLGVRNSEPVFLKAKQFLKSAFLRFAVAGLFVLMFKNQTVSDSNNKDVDLFFVLKTVIDPDDIVPDEDVREVIYLRDQPVRDVLDKLMKQMMERKAFSTVLYNTSRYVELVHTHPYSESTLNEYAAFLNALVKHTADWRRADWNINPVFTMSAILLKEHPYHHSVLIPPIIAMFKHGLQNCTIQPECVVKLLAADSAISSIPGTQPENVFVEVVIEEVINYLTATRSNKDTLLTLLEIILWDSGTRGQEWYTKIETMILGEMIQGHHRTHYFDEKLVSLVPALVNYLKRPSKSQQFTRKDFKICRSAAQLITTICANDLNQMMNVLGYLKLDETRHCLRFLNWFILTILREKEDVLLFKMLGYESVMTDLLVQMFNSVQIDFNSPDLNFSYSSTGEALLLSFSLLKTWVLLKLRTGTSQNEELKKLKVLNPISFWMSVWPALRRLLDMIEPTSLFLAGNIGLSVWNMFLSMLQFLFAARSEVVMIYAYEWSSLLDDLLSRLGEDTGINKNSGMDNVISLEDFTAQVQKLRDMFDIPPVEVPAITMVNQLFLEVRDIMRLQAESLIFQGNSRALLQTIS